MGQAGPAPDPQNFEESHMAITASMVAETPQDGVAVRSDAAHVAVGSYHTYPTPADRRELKKRLMTRLR